MNNLDAQALYTAPGSHYANTEFSQPLFATIIYLNTKNIFVLSIIISIIIT